MLRAVSSHLFRRRAKRSAVRHGEKVWLEPLRCWKRNAVRALTAWASPPPASPSADDAELDRLLAKVGEVGLPGLSDAERATLQRISAARRGRR